jgi:hypothetical protein
MTTKVMVYTYDHIKYPAQIKFATIGTDEWGIGHFDDEAENMLVNLFNEHNTDWRLNSDWEDESAAEAFDNYGTVSL